MFYRMIMVFLTVISTSFTEEEPELGNWRWAEDTLQPTDDKQVHGVGSFGWRRKFRLVPIFLCFTFR